MVPVPRWEVVTASSMSATFEAVAALTTGVCCGAGAGVYLPEESV